jgi:hypothetical protein
MVVIRQSWCRTVFLNRGDWNPSLRSGRRELTWHAARLERHSTERRSKDRFSSNVRYAKPAGALAQASKSSHPTPLEFTNRQIHTNASKYPVFYRRFSSQAKWSKNPSSNYSTRSAYPLTLYSVLQPLRAPRSLTPVPALPASTWNRLVSNKRRDH